MRATIRVSVLVSSAGMMLVTLILAIGSKMPSKNNELIFFSRQVGNYEIYAVDIQHGIIHNLTHSPGDDLRPTWSPDGQQIAFFSDRGNQAGIYIMDANGGGVHLLTNLGTGDAYPIWSPDGQEIVFASSQHRLNAGIYRIHADGSNLRQLATLPTPPALLAWSPDGSRIVFMADCENNCDIYLMNADGSNLQALTHNGVFDVFPAWSPDSHEIVFMSNRDSFFELYTLDVNCATMAGGCNTHARRLTYNRDFDGFPVWSPDGRRIVFSSDRDGNFEIYTLETGCKALQAGCAPRTLRLTYREGNDLIPAWSPDGHRIAFVSGRNVFVMDDDGSHIIHLADDVLPEQLLIWRPD
jgi:Tol biopolymer transport system component